MYAAVEPARVFITNTSQDTLGGKVLLLRGAQIVHPCISWKHAAAPYKHESPGILRTANRRMANMVAIDGSAALAKIMLQQ
jgi:hypothetical protein